MNLYKPKSRHSFSCLTLLLFILFFFLGCRGPSRAPSPKYIFLFIGDGMGISQIHAAQMYRSALNVEDQQASRLRFTGFPVTGFAATHSANHPVTDSAAAATAICSGRKTRNGRINYDFSGKIRFPIFSLLAHEAGIKIGIISSVPLVHATPAAFYAHALHRSRYYEIGLDLFASGFEFFGGGGFVQPQGRDKDRPDVREKAGDANYTIISRLEDVLALDPGEDKVLAVHPALTHDAALPYAIDSSPDAASLADYVRTAADFLEGGKGFFIMAEGGKIDWACHDNDIAAAVREVLALDDAVGEAIKFYDRHPGETLILVTADHETGGLALNSDYPVPPDAALLNAQKISLEEFCLRHINPLREKNTEKNSSLNDIFPEIERFFGLCRLTDEKRRAFSRKAAEGDRDARRRILLSLSDVEYAELERAFNHPRAAQIGETIVRILGAKAGFSWISDSHSAQPVPVFALGQGQENFQGFYDNTDLAVKFADLLDIHFER